MTTFYRQYFTPALLLAIMLAAMLGSSWNDSAIFDETAHIPSGYGILFLRDYRLNPEHPPLAKALAALPLIAVKTIFPTDVKSWQEDINGQWDQGRVFLYESGNNADVILRLMRLPTMLLSLLLGLLLWLWAKKNFDRRVANLALFFYAFSPTVIAHSRFVTTDIAAMFGFFIGITTFILFLKNPSLKNTALAGLSFGAAMLMKFSLILLIPAYFVMIIGFAASQTELSVKRRLSKAGELAARALMAGAISIALIWVINAYAVWNYPPEREFRDARVVLSSFPMPQFVSADLWLIQHRLTRPLGQYFWGLLMVFQRTGGGNTQYFLGQITSEGSPLYFPLLYLLKETFAFHILTLMAILFAVLGVTRAGGKSAGKTIAWIRGHFIEFSSLSFIALYWLISIRSNLNIGVRHILPTFPFIYILVAKGIAGWLRPEENPEPEGWVNWLKKIYRLYIASLPKFAVIIFLLGWIAIGSLAAFPNYLSYFNFLGKGIDNGYKIATDSNYDWGQDLKRLASFAEDNGIEKIAVDYFGGGNPAYYLGDKFEPWWSGRGQYHGWFGVSANAQMGAWGKIGPGFSRKAEDSYEWLKPFRPVARAGKSIFIYRLP